MNDHDPSRRELIQQWITRPLPSLVLVDPSPRQIAAPQEATIDHSDRDHAESVKRP